MRKSGRGRCPHRPAMKKRILSIVLVLSMLTAFMPIMASAAESGTCGENVYWTLDDNGTLTISGTGDMEDYDYSPFYDSNIKFVIIKNGVTSIGDMAFAGCSDLTSITIANSVTSIGHGAFAECGLTSVTIGNSVTLIDSFSFAWCSSLESVTIPDSVTSINTVAFTSCPNLANINVDGSNKNYCDIDGNLFNKDKTELIQYAIGKTDSSYTIPDSVISIDDWAFVECTSLNSITIPDSVKSIGDCAFMDCDKLTDIYYTGTEEQWKAINIDANNHSLTNATIHYNSGTSTPSPTPTQNPDIVETSTDTYEMSEITETENGVTFTVQANEAVSGKQAVLVACYDENGVFIGLQWQQITASENEQTISVEIDKTNTKTVKAFIWNALGYMMPASQPVSLEL